MTKRGWWGGFKLQGSCNEDQNNHNNEKGVKKGNENEGEHCNENQHNHYNKNQCDHHAVQVVALANTFKLQQTQDEPNDEQVHNYNNHQNKHDKEE